MNRPFFLSISSYLALLLGLACVGPARAEIDGRASEILSQMGEQIASLETFVIAGDGYIDARLEAGQLIEHSKDVTLRLRRPGTLRISSQSAESSGEIFFVDGLLTVYNRGSGFYAQKALPQGVDAAVDFAVNAIGIDAPVLDFVYSDVASHLSRNAESIEYFGLSQFRGKRHHHIAIRAPEVDIEIWVTAGKVALPSKMTIRSKWEAGAPRSVFFLNWDTSPDIPPGDLQFLPSEGAVQIEFDLDEAAE